VRGSFERVYPEIKTYRSPDDLLRMARIVRDSGMSARTTWISMDWAALESLRDHDDEVRIGYIVEHPDRFGAALSHAAGDPRAILDPDFRILLEQPALASAARERDVELATWTVNRTEDAAALRAMGVTGFTTNEVTRLLEWGRALPEPAA
jgi:glycerophosphoryl diester phosphodiesterase